MVMESGKVREMLGVMCGVVKVGVLSEISVCCIF